MVRWAMVQQRKHLSEPRRRFLWRKARGVFSCCGAGAVRGAGVVNTGPTIECQAKDICLQLRHHVPDLNCLLLPRYRLHRPPRGRGGF